MFLVKGELQNEGGTTKTKYHPYGNSSQMNSTTKMFATDNCDLLCFCITADAMESFLSSTTMETKYDFQYEKGLQWR